MQTGTPDFARELLAWYDRHARRLPWRVPPGKPTRQDAYRVLLSEVMLQQTTVAVVEKRYPEFLSAYPTVKALANAPEDAVMAAWAGLGYYRRARSLHACAKAIVSAHDGIFPQTEQELKQLPGIGDYTGAAIAAIAFGKPSVVVDGNIERVVSRVRRITAELPKAKKEIRDAAAALMPTDRFGDYAQALMDLGALVCRPKSPDCLVCPVRRECGSAGRADVESFPRKAPKKDKKTVYGKILVCVDHDGGVLCETRPASGLFAGMLGLPGGGWDGSAEPDPGPSFRKVGAISHVLTHRRLEIDVYLGAHPSGLDGKMMHRNEARAALPSLFVKALDCALSLDGS